MNNDIALGDYIDMEEERLQAEQEYLDNELPDSEEVNEMIAKKDIDHQTKLIDKHIAKAELCYELGRFDDGDVHLTIAEILLSGLKSIDYDAVQWL